MHIQIPYTPRPLQAKLHQDLDKHRFAVLNCHRRFGKTILVILHLIRKALALKKWGFSSVAAARNFANKNKKTA